MQERLLTDARSSVEESTTMSSEMDMENQRLQRHNDDLRADLEEASTKLQSEECKVCTLSLRSDVLEKRVRDLEAELGRRV